MKTLNGMTVVLFSQDWNQDELMKMAQASGCQLMRHPSGALQIVRKSEKATVTTIKPKSKESGKVIDFIAVRERLNQPTPRSILRDMFNVTFPDHDPEPTPPSAA